MRSACSPPLRLGFFIDSILRLHARSCDHPFGILLLGDFLQLQPVSVPVVGMLYASILCDERPLFAAADAVANIARHNAGRSLFAQSKRLILSVQQRAKADPAHAAILDHLRTARRFDGLVIRYLRDHVLSPADIERDPTWLLAPTLVATNSDRIRINILKLAVLAVKTAKPIVQWERCIAGGRLSPAAQMLLKVRAESLLTGHFVEGAPAMITVNSDKDAGLVNGAFCSFKRLIFESLEDEKAYNDALVREAALRCDLDPSSASSSSSSPDHGGLLIKLPKPPAAIVVTLWRSGRDFTISADTADGEVNLNVASSNAAAGDDENDEGDGGDGGGGDNDDGGGGKAKGKGKGKGKAKRVVRLPADRRSSSTPPTRSSQLLLSRTTRSRDPLSIRSSAASDVLVEGRRPSKHCMSAFRESLQVLGCGSSLTTVTSRRHLVVWQ